MSTRERHIPGTIATVSGQYALIHPWRGNTWREVTVVRGEKFPPTPESGMWYELSDATQHAWKRGW